MNTIDTSIVGQQLLLLDLDEDAWMNDALCAQTDPEAFFPEKGGSTCAAKAVCAVCPVRPECLAYALEHNETVGIWGGLSATELRALRKASTPRSNPQSENGTAA